MVALAETKPITLFAPSQGNARDAYGRAMTYLRISLTDRCNFRCLYCMPATGMKFQPRDEMLTDEELITVVGACAEIGFSKFRLTGGEPTIRPHLVEIVRAIKRFPGVEEVTMTTNALLLDPLIHEHLKPQFQSALSYSRFPLRCWRVDFVPPHKLNELDFRLADPIHQQPLTFGVKHLRT